jgi:tRNA-specific 2-thiouridylase
MEDAHRVAMALGISHYVADFREYFEKKVIANFLEEYSRGRTPNPCIRCNQHIKYKVLMDKAKKLKADYIATGHHARVDYDADTGRYLLKKGKDKEKDQSYFLYPLTQTELSQTLMPIGDLTKKEVREIARKLGLPVAMKPESQEICFVPQNRYAQFLESRMPEALRSGLIVDLNNRVLGKHRGIIHFTIGQRKGLGIAASHPLYVLAIDAEKDTIIVGANDQLYKKRLLASQIKLISLQKLTKPIVVRAKIRYKHEEAKALVTPLGSEDVQVEFEKPQRAMTPGQAVVFYDGEVVMGGGIIDYVPA